MLTISYVALIYALITLDDFCSLQVCKMFLCGFCPNQLFINTRADLGICNKIHDDELTKK